jgi:hypothetical protein
MQVYEIRSREIPVGNQEQFAVSDSGGLEQHIQTAHREGEKKLLQEILIDAIACWRSFAADGIMDEQYVTGSRERLYREANFWIFGDYNNAPFFSFTQICDCLGLDPNFIRRLLIAWRREHAGRSSVGLPSTAGLEPEGTDSKLEDVDRISPNPNLRV